MKFQLTSLLTIFLSTAPAIIVSGTTSSITPNEADEAQFITAYCSSNSKFILEQKHFDNNEFDGENRYFWGIAPEYKWDSPWDPVEMTMLPPSESTGRSEYEYSSDDEDVNDILNPSSVERFDTSSYLLNPSAASYEYFTDQKRNFAQFYLVFPDGNNRKRSVLTQDLKDIDSESVLQLRQCKQMGGEMNKIYKTNVTSSPFDDSKLLENVFGEPIF